jgi:hypothetical protein
VTLEWESDMPTGSESWGEGKRHKTGAMEPVWLLGCSDVSLPAVKS